MDLPNLNYKYRGTEQMRSGQEIKALAVQRFFEEKITGFSGQVNVSQFRGGQSNPSYRVQAGDQAWVIRRKPPGPLLPSAHAVEREYQVLQALEQTNVPIPRTDFLCMDESVLGTPFYVMECIEGQVHWEALLPEKTPSERGMIYESMNDGIARLHSVDHKALGLENFGPPGNYIARQLKRWGSQYLEADYERIPEMDLLIEWLSERIPKQTKTSIVHGDYRLDNMIFHNQEPRLLAILDWELSTLGDPLADFAYHVMQWRIPRNLQRGMADFNLASLGIPEEKAYVEAYCRRTGRDRIPCWDVYIIFSMFKLSAIYYGILIRQKIGTASSEFAKETGSVARPIAKLAWDQVKKLGQD